MDRRKAMKITAGAILGGGAGLYAIKNAFQPASLPLEEPKQLEYNIAKTSWEYYTLDPAQIAELAYKNYDSGSCMYAAFKSIISPLAEKYGEPYVSFPLHMMKYGHGGVGGYGTLCGALNGAAAVIGLFVDDKAMRDNLITGIFRWYEKTKLPEFRPQLAILGFTPPSTVSNSTLCHVSNTKWATEAGYNVNGDERKERCRRLTSDVASRVTVVLNEYFGNTYLTSGHENETVETCMTCHSDKGKVANTSSKMNCTSCHTESVGHKIFSDVHYKLME